MGRVVEKVPRGWQHPTDKHGRFIPMFINTAYIDALTEWWEEHSKWLKGEHPMQKEDPEAGKYQYYAQWSGEDPPDVKSYNPRKWTEEERVCYQIYETYTAGTPVSPVFNTVQEMESWLVRIERYTPQEAADFCRWCLEPGSYIADWQQKQEQERQLGEQATTKPDGQQPEAGELPELTKKLMERIFTQGSSPGQQKPKL